MTNQTVGSPEFGRSSNLERAFNAHSVYKNWLMSAQLSAANPEFHQTMLGLAESYRQIVIELGHPDPAIPVQCPYPTSNVSFEF